MEPSSLPASRLLPERLARQMNFLIEIDKVKTILRQNRIISDPERRENDAEHMYHFAMMAMVLAEYANEPIDLLRVLKMILVHDIVEIDAGDAFIYDPQALVGKRDREERAADRIFGLLPDDQECEVRELWEEFEAEETPEARFAASIDRLQPLMCNYHTAGGAWREHGITRSKVFERNSKIARGSTELWTHISRVLEDAATQGYMAPDKAQAGSESFS
jgi:putative hydrolases of HD superfamily